MSAKITKALLIGSALILFVLLFIAPKIAPKHNEHDGHGHTASKPETINADNNASLDVYEKLALKNLDPVQGKLIARLTQEKKYDSVTIAWDKLKRNDLASTYVEEKAKKSNKAEDWFEAGKRYYNAIRFTNDKTEVPMLYQCALRCYSKGLKLEPNNTDAKIMLASCYVEGTADPMKGIAMMREVEKTDSNNVQLQLSFAAFSVKSGQLDKAITRFNKAYKIDPTRIDILLYLADAYQQQGNTVKTIEVLKDYGSKTTDPNEKVEINKYIQQLELH